MGCRGAGRGGEFFFCILQLYTSHAPRPHNKANLCCTIYRTLQVAGCEPHMSGRNRGPKPILRSFIFAYKIKWGSLLHTPHSHRSTGSSSLTCSLTCSLIPVLYLVHHETFLSLARYGVDSALSSSLIVVPKCCCVCTHNGVTLNGSLGTRCLGRGPGASTRRPGACRGLDGADKK